MIEGIFGQIAIVLIIIADIGIICILIAYLKMLKELKINLKKYETDKSSTNS